MLALLLWVIHTCHNYSPTTKYFSHIQHHSNLRERDGANSAYFCSLNLWQRGTGSTLPSCVAALACLDSWIQCGMNVILVWAKPCRAVSLDYEKLRRFGQWRQCGVFYFLVKVLSEGNHEFSGASQRRFVAWSYLRGFIKLRGLLKIGRTTSIIFHSNWRPYLMSSVPALRFKVLHGRVSLVGCKDGNLLAVRSFSGWNDFILWKKTTTVYSSLFGKANFS